MVILTAFIVLAGCRNPLGRQYEYEEQIYLGVDGASTLVLNASIPALVALHNLPLDPSPRTPVDRELVRRLFATQGCSDVRVGQPWIRRGRRFVQVRVQAAHVQELQHCGPLAWSTYRFTPADDELVLQFEQRVGAPVRGDPGGVNWDGRELVGFKLHLPSRIIFHNVKRLEDGANGEAERGNILTWEQRLTDRLEGQPLHMEVRMDSRSILHRTLWLFAGAAGAAIVMLAGLIWWTMRRARRRGLVGSTSR